MVALPRASSLRHKELRLAKFLDLDIDNWRLLVSHPKGEGSWVAPDFVPIAEPAWQAVLDFLAEREAFLRRVRAIPPGPGALPAGRWDPGLLARHHAQEAQG